MIFIEPIARRSNSTVVAASPSGARLELHLDEFVQRKHFFHSYERRELAFLHRFLRAGDVYVDVGANVGVLTVEGATAVGSSGRTVAVEPIPTNVDRLRANAALQRDATIDVVAAAIGATTGVLSLGLTAQQAAVGNMGSYSSTAAESSLESALEVPLRRLDDVVDEVVGTGRRIRLLKIDVEGMEADVLDGASGLLGSGRIDAVLFERNAALSDGRPESILTGHGFDVQRLAVGARLKPLGTARPNRTERGSAAGLLPSIAAWIRGDARLETLVAIRPTAAGQPGA
jgi:FkbM family methyltransferase